MMMMTMLVAEKERTLLVRFRFEMKSDKPGGVLQGKDVPTALGAPLAAAGGGGAPDELATGG